MTRKVFTMHGNPAATLHQRSTGLTVPYGQHMGPDGYSRACMSPFVDIYGKTGGVWVANNTPEGSCIYETMAGTNEANAKLGETFGRSWKSSDDTLAISWEVGDKKLFVKGVEYDVSQLLPGLIYCCALSDETTATILTKQSGTEYRIYTVLLSNGEQGSFIRYSFSITIEDPVLFAGFAGLNSKLFVVTTPDSGSVVSLWTYNAPVWTSQVLHTIDPLHCVAEMDYSKELDAGLSGSMMGNTSSSGMFSYMHVHGENLQYDSVVLIGKRIVAVSTDGDRIGILVQHYNGSYLREVDKPTWVTTESVSVFVTAVSVMGIPVGWAYTYGIGYTDYDTGKMTDTVTYDSQSSFDLITINLVSGGIVTSQELDVLPDGSFYSKTIRYTRQAGNSFYTSGYQQPVVPPYVEMWASRPVYNESGAEYDRTYTDSIKLYCADPVRKIFLFQRFNGSSTHIWISNDVVGFASPNPADVARCGHSYTGELETVLRVNGVDTVLYSEPYVEELGIAFDSRYLLNWEPTMPYYTQYQGTLHTPTLDIHGTFTNSENKDINKSINVAFKGRYIDSDSQKTLVSWGFTSEAEMNLSATYNFRTFEDINYKKYDRTWYEGYEPPSWQNILGWGEFIRRAGFKTISNVSGSAFAVGSTAYLNDFKTLPVSLRMTLT